MVRAQHSEAMRQAGRGMCGVLGLMWAASACTNNAVEGLDSADQAQSQFDDFVVAGPPDVAELENYVLYSHPAVDALPKRTPNEGINYNVTLNDIGTFITRGYYPYWMILPSTYGTARVLNVGCAKARYDAQQLARGVDWYAADLPQIAHVVRSAFSAPNRYRIVSVDFVKPEGVHASFERQFDVVESTLSVFSYTSGYTWAKPNREQLRQALTHVWNILKPGGELRMARFDTPSRNRLEPMALSIGFELDERRSGLSREGLRHTTDLLKTPYDRLSERQRPRYDELVKVLTPTAMALDWKTGDKQNPTREAIVAALLDDIRSRSAPEGEYLTYRKPADCDDP